MEVGVLFVGAGPANLAGAIRLMQFLNREPAIKEALGEIPVAMIEKGKYVGAHLLAGAIFNPISLKKIFPRIPIGAYPFHLPVAEERFYFLSEQKSYRLPVPPSMRNRGNFAISLSRLGQWLAKEAEQLGVVIFTETPAIKLLVENNVVRGVKTGDKSKSRTGEHLANFQEGVEMLAKATVLGEGGQGHLTQSALAYFGVSRANPQTFSLGVKEVWELPRPYTSVIHTMGWPLRGGKEFAEFGGSFLYPMEENKLSLGLVVGLGYHDATLSVHDLLQQMKGHSLFKAVLKGGERIAWGAKTIPEGGYYAIPERLAIPGALIVGDGASLLNVPALKGIHYAMASGIIAADTICSALKGGQDISSYGTAMRESFIFKDLYKVRNMRQAFDYGFVSGVLLAGLMTATGGLLPGWQFKTKADKEAHLEIPAGALLAAPLSKMDKTSSVHLSGNKSRDDQPNHIRIETHVPEAIGEAWIHICPANVYEWGHDENGQKVVRMNPTNCVQCGAIGAKGGQLTPPEGGSGPEYKET
ncbi:MAG: 4Fe-4S dicluster domain-containing protein [Nitrospirae bacterium]|nr:4Fe-4S dicluster domain-containing protein [Candidatus Troglogloeales bacterium]MBI3597991.1 4Fe-4S dicluster domain-containing protein [Candidatus Troglogloeales bacterium]